MRMKLLGQKCQRAVPGEMTDMLWLFKAFKYHLYLLHHVMSCENDSKKKSQQTILCCLKTSPGPASMDLICLPDSRSQRRMWASRELEAAMAPLWLMSTDTTPSWWPSRVHCSSSFSSDLQRAVNNPEQGNITTKTVEYRQQIQSCTKVSSYEKCSWVCLSLRTLKVLYRTVE